MRTLKILVVVMGMLLVAGFVTLVVVVAGRVAQRQSAEPAPRPVAQPFARSPVELPSGSRIESMAVGSDRLALNLVLGDGNREILIIDLTSGQRLGAIPLHTAPPIPAPPNTAPPTPAQ